MIILLLLLMALDKVCFDNQVSTFSDKILWFEVNVEDPDDDYTDDDDYFGDCAWSQYHSFQKSSGFQHLIFSDPEDWDKMVENNEDTQSLFDIKVFPDNWST